MKGRASVGMLPGQGALWLQARGSRLLAGVGLRRRVSSEPRGDVPTNAPAVPRDAFQERREPWKSEVRPTGRAR